VSVGGLIDQREEFVRRGKLEKSLCDYSRFRQLRQLSQDRQVTGCSLRREGRRSDGLLLEELAQCNSYWIRRFLAVAIQAAEAGECAAPPFGRGQRRSADFPAAVLEACAL
jgi:hypothetical protein